MSRQITLPDEVDFLLQEMPDSGNPRYIGKWLANRDAAIERAAPKLCNELRPGEAEVLLDVLLRITGKSLRDDENITVFC